MDIEYLRNFIDTDDNLSAALGIEYISVSTADICLAKMQVDSRTRQPFGMLSGGASLAIAENLAGVASLSICVPKVAVENADYEDFQKYFLGVPVGANISANHIRPARDGEKLVAEAKLLHKGHSQHIWKVEIKNEKGMIISMATVTNHIIPASDVLDSMKKEIFLKLVKRF